MEGSVMALSSSTPTKPPATPKPSASDENEHYYQQLGSPNLSNPKKSMKKHYMSPTISAACKAVSSRKNILGERNEVSESVFSNTHVEKATPLTPPVSKSLCDEQNVVSDDLSSRPYDPVTNYLSPRPQFLRYNPNRRRELILGLGNSNAEGIDGLSLSSSGSFESQKASDEEGGSFTTSSSSDKQEDEDVEEIDEKCEGIDGEIKGGDAEIEGIDEVIEGRDEVSEGSDGEIEESDEEDEEVEEEKKGCNLKGVMKSLLVLVVLVLFTSHMASMNQETLFESVEEASLRSENHTFETDSLKKLESGSNLWDHREEGQWGLVGGVKGGIDIGIEEGKGVEPVEHELGSEVLGQEQQIKMDFMEGHRRVDEEVKEEVKVEDENLGTVEHADKPREVLASQAEESEALQLTEGEEKRGVDDLGEVVVLEVEDIEEISDQLPENSELRDVVSPGNDESSQLNQTPSMADEVDLHNLVFDASNAFEVEGKVAVEPIHEMIESKMEGKEYSSNMMAEFVMSETMDDDKTGLHGEILNSGAEQKWGEELLNHMKSKTFYRAIAVGVSIFSVVAVSLALVFHLRRKKAISKDSSVIANTGSMKNLIIEQKKMIGKSAISEKYNSALSNREEDNSIEQDVYSSFRRMSLSSNSDHSSDEGSEAYHSKAPRIELLGEFVVGEVSSSLRSCGLKNKMREGEESNYAVSSEKKSRSKAHSVSIQQQPSVSEFSYMGSFSHGSYTSEKKIKPTESEFSSMDTSHGSYTSEKIVKMKKGGKNGEVKVIATPVRRSSRIRSKTVMSP
ncbi:hypothetical protein ABKV19_009134 [Rosa sericea]